MNKSAMKHIITLCTLALVAGSAMAQGTNESTTSQDEASVGAKQKAQALCEANCNDAELCRNSIHTKDNTKDNFGKMWLDKALADNVK